MVSSCLRKEGRTKDTGVAKEMGSGVGLGGGVGNSLIRSAICSSGPIQGCLLCRDGPCSVTTSRQNRHDDGTTSRRTLLLP